jgi:formate dehydrogenase subunit beta
MMVNTVLNGNALDVTRAFFRKLIEEGIVDYLLVPSHIAKGRTLVPTLFKDPGKLDEVNPFSLVMPVNAATIVGQLSNAGKGIIGVVMKPCEIRALIELVKLGQAKLDHLFIIGVDCAGTFEVEDYASHAGEEWDAPEKEQGLLADLYVKKIDEDKFPMKLRSPCRICKDFTPQMGNITLGLLGMEDGVLVGLDSELAERVSLTPEDEPYGHQSLVEDLSRSRTYRREQVFEEYRDKMKSISDMADTLATCTRCYACQSACPICYCKVCFFRTDTFDPEAERYLRWADKEGAVPMPTEILLYHLTRLNHIAASCIGCGMCESACPRNIPLSTIFQAVGDEVQKKLEYIPGRSIEDELPVATFKKVE